MSLHVIAVLTDAATTPACLDAAAAAGRKHHEVRLCALHVSIDHDRIVRAAEKLGVQRLREEREGSTTDRDDDVRAVFHAWSATHSNVSITLQSRVGRQEEVVATETNGADLVVMVHGGNLDADDTLHATILAAKAPVLLLPRGWQGDGWSHVAIAWNGSEVAERAVIGALPWLAWADQVTILTIGDGTGAQQLCDDLGLAGIHAMVEYRERSDRPLGEQLVTLTREVGPDALVAGTTRHLLTHADQPLFLAR